MHVSILTTSRSPEDTQIVLIKRIIAIEGDLVKTLPPYPDPEIQVPKGHIWVEGLELVFFFSFFDLNNAIPFCLR
jgi:inner membrane protease subunit 2